MANTGVEYVLSLKDLFTSKIRGATQETEKLNSAVSKTQSAFSGMGSALAGLGLTIGVGALANEMINVGSTFEKAEVQLRTLLKSSTEAEKVFNDLKKEATTSPFGFETLLKGNAALISTGIAANQAKDDFNSLANAIAATGGGEDELSRMVFNLQQIKNVGATAADIKQFGMAGINIFGLLDDYAVKYGITLDKQHITYEQIVGAFKLAGKEGGQYFGALDNMALTTSGKLSNLKDAFKNTLYDVFVALKPVIDETVVVITKFFELIKSGIAFIQENKTAFMIFGSVLAAIATGMAVVKAQLIATAIAQWALNTATAVFDALSGNWVALAAGAVALAGGIYMASKAQEGLNKELGKQPSAGTALANPLEAKGGKQQTATATTKTKGGTSTSAVESRGVQNFNISIKALVETLQFTTNNMKESSAVLKEEVAKALIEAVNDFQLMATK